MGLIRGAAFKPALAAGFPAEIVAPSDFCATAENDNALIRNRTDAILVMNLFIMLSVRYYSPV